MQSKGLRARLKTAILEAAYKGEVFFSRVQGIASNDPRYNGEYWLVRRLGKRIKVAVDAGCNIGDWTAEVLRHASPSCLISCVEPDPDNAQRIAARFAGNDRVRLWQVALSSSVGTARFERGQGRNSGVGHLTSATECARPTIEVETTTLDVLADTYPGVDLDIVKVDIEGAEMALLRGAHRLLEAKRIGIIQLEYNGTWLGFGTRLNDLFELAERYSYQVLVATPLGAARLPSYGIGMEDFRLRNVLLARADFASIIEPFGPAGRAKVEAHRNLGASNIQ